MTQPPPRKPKPDRYPILITPHCKKCGKSQVFAAGYISEFIPRSHMLKVMVQIGWQVAPIFLCRGCACPMEWAEKDKATELFQAINTLQAGSEFRLFKFEEYWADMGDKYGPAVDKYFSTMTKKEIR